jgi:3-oxoacid CoA-transferase A subunit
LVQGPLTSCCDPTQAGSVLWRLDRAPDGSGRDPVIDKIVRTIATALNGVRDGSTVLVGGFGSVGQPDALVEGLIEQGARDLTVVSNNAGAGRIGLAKLLDAGRVRNCSFPRSAGSVVFEELFKPDRLELEIVPQGTLAERIRAAGAGVGAFYTPTAYGTKLAEGKETVSSRGGITFWNTRCPAMSLWWRLGAPTAWATAPIVRAAGTSIR